MRWLASALAVEANGEPKTRPKQKGDYKESGPPESSTAIASKEGIQDCQGKPDICRD
jgi:hypothetical protein